MLNFIENNKHAKSLKCMRIIYTSKQFELKFMHESVNELIINIYNLNEYPTRNLNIGFLQTFPNFKVFSLIK